MFHAQKPEVLVVGAGPVGLLAAFVLKKHDVEVAIIDQNARASQHSYALAIHPGTLEVLDRFGLAAALLPNGRPLTKVAFYEGGDRHAEIDLSKLQRKHPFVLVLRQSILERAIEDELKRLGVKVLWNHRLHSLRDADDAAVVEVSRLDQVATGYPVQRTDWVVVKTVESRPAFVIGADGYDSMVRRSSGIETKELGGRIIVSVFEIEAEGEDLPQEARVVLDPDVASVYWPLEPGRCRWGFQIAAASQHEPEMDRLRALLAERAPWFAARPTAIYWSTLAAFESGVSEPFGRGRAWLAGDAAHLAPPIGVHSMNVGLREASDLATRIAGILRKGAAMKVLQEYDAAARTEWRMLLGQGSGIHVLADASPWIGKNSARMLATIPASGSDLEPLLRQIGLASQT